MIATPQDRAVADWLRRLKWALAALPESDRDDIVAEAAAHLEEAAAAGRSTGEILTGFGAPELYARPFLDQAELARALGSQTAADLAGAVARRVHRSLVAALAGAALLAIVVVMFVAVTLVVMEVQDPIHTGLWLGAHVRFIGQIDDPSIARDLLGGWLIPLAAVVIGGGWVIGRLLLLAAVRRLARPG